MVLRAYQRGGLVSRFNRQTYLGINRESSRSFREWRLLQWMYEQGLPVPQPIAASICRWPFALSPFYRAWILVQRIENTQTLDHYLSIQSLAATHWQAIGQCIARFHRHNIYHADLNANNVLLDNQQNIYLIDFDRAQLRSGADKQARWKQDNLQRLRRSLFKQQGLHGTYFFQQANWEALLKGYQQLSTDY